MTVAHWSCPSWGWGRGWDGVGVGVGVGVGARLRARIRTRVRVRAKASVRGLAGSSPVPQIWLRKRCHVWPLTRGRSGDALVDCAHGEGRGIAKGRNMVRGAAR